MMLSSELFQRATRPVPLISSASDFVFPWSAYVYREVDRVRYFRDGKEHRASHAQYQRVDA